MRRENEGRKEGVVVERQKGEGRGKMRKEIK